MKFAYPSGIVQRYLYGVVHEYYQLVRTYDVGKTTEFLLVSQLQQHPNLLECIRTKYSALHSKLDFLSKNRQEQAYTIESTLELTNVIVQNELTYDLPTGPGCHLIKLKEGYYAIDFIIIERSASGKDAENLFRLPQ